MSLYYWAHTCITDQKITKQIRMHILLSIYWRLHIRGGGTKKKERKILPKEKQRSPRLKLPLSFHWDPFSSTWVPSGSSHQQQPCKSCTCQNLLYSCNSNKHPQGEKENLWRKAIHQAKSWRSTWCSNRQHFPSLQILQQHIYSKKMMIKEISD